jgi:Fic family protein
MSNRYASLDDRNDDLRERLQDHPDIAAALIRRYDMSWLFHENALEGIVLSEAELSQSLEQQVVADASLMSTVTLIRNHRQALETVRATAQDRKARVTVALIKDLHETIIRGTIPPSKDKPVLRREMPLHRSYFHDIMHPDRIETELHKLCDFTRTSEFREFHGITQAAYVHWQLMQIFPYTEQSGRIARLLQTLFLARAGYLPAILHSLDRQRYYESLKMPLASLRNLLMDALENSLENATRFVKKERSRAARKAASE